MNTIHDEMNKRFDENFGWLCENSITTFNVLGIQQRLNTELTRKELLSFIQSEIDLVKKQEREKTIDECIACVPEIKDIGYETEQEKPNLQDEVLADFYETKAEAFFAGCDKTVEKTITNLTQLKNNG